MKTSNNIQSNESKNRVINYDIEIVRDFDGTYYVNARNELHEHIKGLPEYLPYKELKKAVKEALGVTLPTLKSLTFEGNGRKQYANAYGLQGIEIHQEPLAFGLQDKVVLGSFGESRPYAIGCTVTGYRWDSEAGEFLYILQGEDGKEYADFARNIIPDGRDLLPEPPAEIAISTDGESHEPTLYERHNITAKEREAKTKGSASYIRRQARMARCAFYYHKGARIETSIAYRNGTDDPDGMSYKVCWYDETQTGELHLVECENGISLEQAARHMADFSLLSECGLTLREILYPAA